MVWSCDDEARGAVSGLAGKEIFHGDVVAFQSSTGTACIVK